MPEQVYALLTDGERFGTATGQTAQIEDLGVATNRVKLAAQEEARRAS